ncbi:MAG: low temperature requirement protein A [Novosphingobium sp.]|nr:low temperature requirement protein A [Novosphingobium sp.]
MPAPPAEASRPCVGAALAAAAEERRISLLRNHAGGPAPVSPLELFFDLVYVFAITQLSHYLLEHLTLLGALQTAVLFGAVWWAWMYTTWATNWIDPERAPNRFLLGAVMLVSLVMSTAIGEAFGDGGLRFAAAYVAIQVGRCLYVSWAMERGERGAGRNMLRAAIWFIASAPLWLAGGLAQDDSARLGLWLAALAIDYSGPLALFRVPGLGRSSVREWVISGSHMAERCGLFIIIALGEGLLISGAEYVAATGQPGLNLALVNVLVGSFAMWWLYFDVGARRAAWYIEHHRLPGLIGRQAFTYWHIPIVAGIVVLAVADEKVLAHPLEPAHGDFVTVIGIGMVLFLGGMMGFKRISSRRGKLPFSHGVGLALVAPLALWGLLGHPSALALFTASTAIFVIVAIWEWVSFHGGWLERIEALGLPFAATLRARAERRRMRGVSPEEQARG